MPLQLDFPQNLLGALAKLVAELRLCDPPRSGVRLDLDEERALLQRRLAAWREAYGYIAAEILPTITDGAQWRRGKSSMLGVRHATPLVDHHVSFVRVGGRRRRDAWRDVILFVQPYEGAATSGGRVALPPFQYVVLERPACRGRTSSELGEAWALPPAFRLYQPNVSPLFIAQPGVIRPVSFQPPLPRRPADRATRRLPFAALRQTYSRTDLAPETCRKARM